MTVRELIAQLTEYEMDWEIEIVGNHGMGYEVFDQFEVVDKSQLIERSKRLDDLEETE